MLRREVLGVPFAEGRTAEFFHLEGGPVLKLFRPGWDGADARKEAAKTADAHSAGLPVPAVYGVTQVEGRYGILYEEIVGKSLMKLLQQRPWGYRALARLLADLHPEVHKVYIPTLPRATSCLARAIAQAPGLPAEHRESLLSILKNLPDGEAVCHGDFHPGNVYLTKRGAVILDWMDAMRGNLLADVARTVVLLRAAALPQSMSGHPAVGLYRRAFQRTYLRHYLTGGSPLSSRLGLWVAVAAAARLAEQVAGEEKALLNLVHRGLRVREGGKG